MNPKHFEDLSSWLDRALPGMTLREAHDVWRAFHHLPTPLDPIDRALEEIGLTRYGPPPHYRNPDAYEKVKDVAVPF